MNPNHLQDLYLCSRIDYLGKWISSALWNFSNHMQSQLKIGIHQHHDELKAFAEDFEESEFGEAFSEIESYVNYKRDLRDISWGTDTLTQMWATVASNCNGIKTEIVKNIAAAARSSNRKTIMLSLEDANYTAIRIRSEILKIVEKVIDHYNRIIYSASKIDWKSLSCASFLFLVPHIIVALLYPEGRFIKSVVSIILFSIIYSSVVKRSSPDVFVKQMLGAVKKLLKL